MRFCAGDAIVLPGRLIYFTVTFTVNSPVGISNDDMLAVGSTIYVLMSHPFLVMAQATNESSAVMRKTDKDYRTSFQEPTHHFCVLIVPGKPSSLSIVRLQSSAPYSWMHPPLLSSLFGR